MKRIVSLALILLLLASLVGCGTTENATKEEPSNVEASNTENAESKEDESDIEVNYEDGIYFGEGEGMHHLKVSVEVADGKIVKVEVVEHEETEGIADEALEKIPAAIVEKNSPNVDTVSGATFTSEGIMEAVKNALEGGPSEEEPNGEEVSYQDGVYFGEAEGMHHLKVSVEVADGKIVKVEVVEHEETEGIADGALEQIPAAIVEKNSPKVEIVSGATFTSEGIMEAVKNALEEAK